MCVHAQVCAYVNIHTHSHTHTHTHTHKHTQTQIYVCIMFNTSFSILIVESKLTDFFKFDNQLTSHLECAKKLQFLLIKWL